MRVKWQGRDLGILALMLAWALGGARSAAGQSGAATTGAPVLQLPAGGRAAALSGAYTAAASDADVLFYNPAGIAGVGVAAGLSYERRVLDTGFASGSGVFQLGRVHLGAGVAFLDYGSIDVLEPDPDFGGQTGRPTGEQVSASEVAARLAAALPLLDERLRVGAAVGFVSSSLAESSRSTPLVDLGAQYALPRVTFGAALRNLGGSLSGGGLADARLPTEARVGSMVRIARPGGPGAVLSADFVANLPEKTSGLAAGVEAGLLPAADRVGAVARFGYNGTAGSEGLGKLQLGAGLSMGSLALDYAYQHFQYFGSVHRFGLRWMR